MKRLYSLCATYWEAATLFVLIAGYCIIQFRSLLVPGLGAEEVADGIQTQQIIHMGLRNIGAWPLSIGGYHGALQSYLLAPFFLVIKQPFLALRIGEVFFSLIVIVVSYLCARKLFNPIIAIFMLVLLLPTPVFIYASRISTPQAGIMTAFYLGALLCLKTWHESGKDLHLFIAAFLLGAGLCLRLWFYWFYVGLLLASLVYHDDILNDIHRPHKFSRFIGALLSFTVGIGLYIAKEVKHSGVEIFGYGLAHIHYTAGLAANNFAILKNLGERGQQFIETLSGYMLDQFPDYPLAHRGALLLRAGNFYVELLALSILCIGILAHERLQRKALFFILLLLGMFLPSCVTLSVMRQKHLFILFPLPQIIMGMAAYLLLDHARQKKRLWGLACIGLALYAAAPVFYLWEFNQMESFVRLTGGTGAYSDANLEMTRWLEEHHDFAPKICDSRLFGAIDFISDLRINSLPCWQYRALPDSCLGGNNAYIFGSGASELASLTSILADTGKKFVLQKTFLTRNGEPAYAIYSIEDMPRRTQ